MDDTTRLNNEYGAAILPGQVLKIFTHDRTGPTVTLDEQAMHTLIDFLCSAMGGCDLLKDEMARADRLALTTRPAPLQGPDPAMTLGAATDEPDARELWGIWLTDEGRWLEMPSEIETPVYLVRFGFSYSIACAVAHNASVCGYPAETRRIDLWAAGLPTD